MKKMQIRFVIGILGLMILTGCKSIQEQENINAIVEESSEMVMLEMMEDEVFDDLLEDSKVEEKIEVGIGEKEMPEPSAAPEASVVSYLEDDNVYGNTTGNIYNAGLFHEDAENYYLYYIYEDCIYRTNKVTGESVRLGNGQLMEVSIDKGFIYGSRVGDISGLIEIDMDTGVERVLREGNYGLIQLVNRDIYYFDLEGYQLRKLDLDTLEEKVMIQEGVKAFTVYKDMVFFVLEADSQHLYCMSNEGGEMHQLTDMSTNLPLVYKDKIYFTATKEAVSALYSMNLDGSNMQILKEVEIATMNIRDGVLYYVDCKNSNVIYAIDLEQEEASLMELNLEEQIRASMMEYSKKPFERLEVSAYTAVNLSENSMFFGCTNLIDGDYYFDEFIYDFEKDIVIPLAYFCYEEPILPDYTVEDLNITMYVQSSVNVRKGPSTDYEKVGNLSTNQAVKVTGLASTGWYRIDFNGQEAFVSQKYLGESEVVVHPPAPKEELVVNHEVQSVTRSYPAGDYSKGSIYGPKLNQTELNQVADAVQNFLNSYDFTTMTEYEKVQVAHDYLCNICEYAPDWSQNRANTAWGALVYGEAQCSGYARAMKALCDAMGIGCYYVHADENAINPSHQWNTVQIDGNWYIVDVQGDDKYGGYFFFLVSDATYELYGGMSWDKSSIPACSNDYF